MSPTIHELRTHTDNHMSFRETSKDRQKAIQEASKAFRQHTSQERIQEAILRQGGAK